MTRSFTSALLGGTALAGLCAFGAQAQTPLKAPPPQFSSVDARGVDLTNGKLITSITPVQIGDPNGAGIAYSRTYYNTQYRDNVTGTLTLTSGVYYLSIGGSTDTFTKSGTTFSPTRNVGQTLVQSGTTLTYTASDGTRAIFSTALADRTLPLPLTEGNIGRITSLRRPNGETWTFTYDVAFNEVEGQTDFWVIRLRQVDSNYGYALRLTYVDDSDNVSYSGIDNWRKLLTVTAFNLADCVSLASCPAGTTWPSATFSGSNITDQSGRAIFLGSTGTGAMAIRMPANPTVDAPSVAYDTTTSRVTALSNAGGTWNYVWSEASGVRTATVTDPASGFRSRRRRSAQACLLRARINSAG